MIKRNIGIVGDGGTDRAIFNKTPQSINAIFNRIPESRLFIQTLAFGKAVNKRIVIGSSYNRRI